MLLTLGLHKNSLVRSYSEHRILTPKIPKQSGKTVVTILVTTVSIFSMVLSASSESSSFFSFFVFQVRKSLSFFEREGWRSLRRALASI